MGKELKVYQVNDCDWWVTDTLENLLIAYEEETGEEIESDIIEECDLDNAGMFWSFEDIPEMEIVIKLLMKYVGQDKSHIKIEMDGKEYCFSHRDGYGMWVNYRRALELDGEYEKPHLIATTEY